MEKVGGWSLQCKVARLVPGKIILYYDILCATIRVVCVFFFIEMKT